METRIYRSAKHALLVGREDVEGLANFLSQRYQHLEFSAHCTDGSTLTTTVAAEILDFENRNDRRIDELKLAFRQADVQERGDVEFGDAGTRLCRWTVWSNDDGLAQQVATELGQRIRATRPWYSWLSRTYVVFIFPVFLMLLGTIGIWRHLLRTGRLPSMDHPTPDFSEMIAILLPFSVVVVLGLLFIDKAWAWMFPKLWFLIGRQKREFRKRERVRRWVFGGVIGAIVIGVIANYLSALLIK